MSPVANVCRSLRMRIAHMPMTISWGSDFTCKARCVRIASALVFIVLFEERCYGFEIARFSSCVGEDIRRAHLSVISRDTVRLGRTWWSFQYGYHQQWSNYQDNVELPGACLLIFFFDAQLWLSRGDIFYCSKLRKKIWKRNGCVGYCNSVS